MVGHGGGNAARSVFALESPAREPARVVYFINSHVNPDQVVRLVKACRSGSDTSRVVLHHDHNVSRLDPLALDGIGNVHLLRAGLDYRYGTFTTIRILLRCLGWMTEHLDFDWVVYLSGQDYPVKPPRRIEHELAATPHDGFFDAVPVDHAPWHLGVERYLYRYYELPPAPGWSRLRKALRRRSDAARARGERAPRVHVPHHAYGPRRVGVRPLSGPFGPGFRCHVGSAWWTLSRRCVEYVLAFARRNPALGRHYERSLFAPGESYFMTVLLNAPGFDIRRDDDRRFVRWSDLSSGHPDVLAARDFPDLVASGDDFARKVDQRRAPELVDLLDQHIAAANDGGGDGDGVAPAMPAPRCRAVG